tara:strand:+ start:618 stop:845 length:228 start_codon:yes stop_codon:yes gene_type:complete
MFKDRLEAALMLKDKLKKYSHSNSFVLGVPRGGVLIVHVIAKKLELYLNNILSKKIVHPNNKENSIGVKWYDTHF